MSQAPRSGNIALQFAKYVVVGGVAFVIDFLTLYLLTEWSGIYYILSATAGFTAGLISNYLLCLAWIFQHRAVSNPAHEFAIFGIIGIAGLLINNALIFGLTEWGGVHYLVSKLIAAALILVFNFSLRRQILFSERATAQP